MTPWDRRVVRALGASDAARRGALILRVLSGVIAAVGLIGSALYLSSGFVGSYGTRAKAGWFLQQIAVPLGIGGVVLGLSFLVEVYASRLDLDIVASDEDETEAKQAPNGSGN